MFPSVTFQNVITQNLFSEFKSFVPDANTACRGSTWMSLWCRLLIFLVSSNLLWLSPSLSGHVQRSTAVLHCEERASDKEREREREERKERERSFDNGVLIPCNILAAIPCVREHLEDKRLYLCIVHCWIMTHPLSMERLMSVSATYKALSCFSLCILSLDSSMMH